MQEIHEHSFEYADAVIALLTAAPNGCAAGEELLQVF
jgi:hypothetical protein